MHLCIASRREQLHLAQRLLIPKRHRLQRRGLDIRHVHLRPERQYNLDRLLMRVVPHPHDPRTERVHPPRQRDQCNQQGDQGDEREHAGPASGTALNAVSTLLLLALAAEGYDAARRGGGWGEIVQVSGGGGEDVV